MILQQHDYSILTADKDSAFLNTHWKHLMPRKGGWREAVAVGLAASTKGEYHRFMITILPQGPQATSIHVRYDAGMKHKLTGEIYSVGDTISDQGWLEERETMFLDELVKTLKQNSFDKP